MTLDKDMILKGLHCCSRTNPDCDNCPFVTKEVPCRELASDAENLIKSLLSNISELEQKLIEINGIFSQGDFANGLALLILEAERIEHNSGQD